MDLILKAQYWCNMEIIQVKGFENISDPVKTEHTIFEQISRLSSTLKTDYVYVAMPIADFINKIGLPNTQLIINNVCSQHQEKKLFFVCQHIQVCNLNFRGNLVFTPHATILDSFVPIPHYSCTYDLDLVKPWDEREYEFSFVGSFLTHPVRRKLYDYFKERKDCLIVDTGSWHFEGSKEKQEINSRKYVEILGNTKYSLCPRGTGPSTIRMWEAMAMGSCPVILSDYLKMPLELFLNSKLWFKIPEEYGIIDIEQKTYDTQEYWEWFSNENLYKSILSVIK